LWLAEQAPDAADRWFESIYDTIGSLEIFPERCPLAPGSEFFNSEIRETFHGRRQHKYRILFTASENEVHVLHVRHGAPLALGETAPEE
jgi:plasmid stabilization system protein ParE